MLREEASGDSPVTRHAFFLSDNRVIQIANPEGASFQYRAQPHNLPAGLQAGPYLHDGAETILLVRSGTVEAMVNGASAIIGAGEFVRVPPGATFGYRNAGDDPALLLCRTAPKERVRPGLKVTVHLTAA